MLARHAAGCSTRQCHYRCRYCICHGLPCLPSSSGVALVVPVRGCGSALYVSCLHIVARFGQLHNGVHMDTATPHAYLPTGAGTRHLRRAAWYR